ncbi:PAS domain-containing protein, partial [Clostridium aciditolerans]
MLNLDKSIRDSLIADSLSEWIWEYDLITGETAIIGALVNFLGYSKNEIIEHMDFWFTLIHPDDVDQLSNAFKKVIDGKDDYFMAEYRIKSKYQGYKWIKSNGKALKNENGKNIYIAGYHTDITSFKHIEESKQKHTTIFNNVNDIIFLSPLN